MSKTISAELKAHMAGEHTTLATCWRVTRTDGEEFFFTDHDVDIPYSGDTYESTSGMIPTALSQNKDLSVDNMDVVAFLESDKISEADIIAKLFDYASVDIFIINYEDTSMGVLYLAQEWTIGEVEIRDNAFQSEIRSRSQHLQQQLCETYGPECRAELGDARCTVDLDDSAGTYRYEGTVTSVSDDRLEFIDANIPSAITTDVFTHGKLVWTGPSACENITYEVEVKEFDVATGTFTLFEAMPYAIDTGDEFTAYWGCKKDFPTCRDTFDNAVNFRGEPHVPGWDKTTKINSW